MNCKEFIQRLDADPAIAGSVLAEVSRDDPSGGFSGVDASIESHARECPGCSKSMAASRLARSLLKVRLQEQIYPSIYFASRVAALARENAGAIKPSFASMWRAARLVVSSIIVLIVVLFAINYTRRSGSVSSEGQGARTANQSLLERVIVDDGTQQPMTNAQVLDSLYGSEDNYGAN